MCGQAPWWSGAADGGRGRCETVVHNQRLGTQPSVELSWTCTSSFGAMASAPAAPMLPHPGCVEDVAEDPLPLAVGVGLHGRDGSTAPQSALH